MLTHQQRILDVPSLDEVLDHHYVNPQNIIHNMTKVNKHGVATLDDFYNGFTSQTYKLSPSFIYGL